MQTCLNECIFSKEKPLSLKAKKKKTEPWLKAKLTLYP